MSITTDYEQDPNEEAIEWFDRQTPTTHEGHVFFSARIHFLAGLVEPINLSVCCNLLDISEHEIETILIAYCGISTKPCESRRSASMDLSHVRDLLVALLCVFLLDADGACPQPPQLSCKVRCAERIIILCVM